MHSCINKGHMAEKHDECVLTVDSQPEEQLGHHSYNLAIIECKHANNAHNHSDAQS